MKKMFLTLIAVAGLSVMSFAQTAQAAQASAGESASKAVAAFATEKHDFGTVPQGTPVTHSFTFTNKGKEVLFIKSASASCGCTVPDYTKEAIAPGGTGVIKVTYSAAAIGPINKTVTVTTNSATTPVVILSIAGEVKATATTTAPAAAAPKTETAKPAKS